ncbi:MAG TPA: hypothetical protein VHA34_03405 [Actinomycetes bacterium]|nr:hypothetical protein [Actinomycetes bacterium]
MTSRTNRPLAGTRAWWRTSRRRSLACGPAPPISAATPPRRSGSPAGPWPSWTRANGCWNPSPTGTWSRPTGCAAGRRRPNAASSPPSPASPPGRATGQLTLAGWGYDHLGHAQRAQGRLDAALATYQEALEVVAGEPGQPAMPAAGVAHVGLAEVCYERDQLDAALEHAIKGVALSRQLGWTLPMVAGLTILARIRQAQGDTAAALEAVREAEQAQLSDAVVGLLNPLPAFRARLALAIGQVDAAARWIQRRGLGVDDEPSYPREREYLVLARVLLAKQAPEQALAMLEPWTALAASQGRTESSIELLALQALGHAARSDQEAALAALAEALRLGAPEGYLRVFLDEGAPMAALLGTLATSLAQAQTLATAPLARAHLDRLIQAFARHGQPVLARPRPGGAMAPGLVRPLSARELGCSSCWPTACPTRPSPSSW